MVSGVMRRKRQTVKTWKRGDDTREFARAIAFANVDLHSDPQAEWAMVTAIEDQGPLLQTCRFEPFRAEILRALREPEPPSPEALFFRTLRPIYGLNRVGSVIEAQVSMRRLLDSIMAGTPDEYIRQMSGFTLNVSAGVSGTGRRMLPGTAFNAPPGYPNILYGVTLGGELGFWPRLTKCRACGRYIFGRTARPVRFCAVSECQSLSAKPKSEALTPDAAYQRAHRERMRRWQRFISDIGDAQRQHGKTPEPDRWELLALRGRRLLKECFKRPTATRDHAQRIVALTESRFETEKMNAEGLKKLASIGRGRPSSRLPSASSRKGS